MRSRIRFYDRSGVPLDEITATTKRSWLLNNVGTCTFEVSRRDNKLVREMVEFGNRILVTNPHTKPWGGILDTPRVWTKKGALMTAYSHEFVFSFYQNIGVDEATNIAQGVVMLTGTAGSIFTQIIQSANEEEDTLVRLGEIHLGGVLRQQSMSGNYLSNISSLASRAGNDFDVVPYEQANNTLLFLANWYGLKGKVLDITLEQGVNIEVQDEILIEQGTILNAVLGIGAGATEANRIGALRFNEDSRERFGLRKGSITFSSVKEVATLSNNTESYLSRNSYPRTTARVSCVDKTLFHELDEGDIVRLVLHDAGFNDNGTIGTDTIKRVVGLQTDDAIGNLEILVDDFRS